MNASQIHLALTHLPVILSLAGMVALGIGLARKNQALKTTALYIIAIAGIAALPVFFSGEGAEEIVEGLPGVSEAVIERHESVAKLSFIAVLISGLLAMLALVKYISPTGRKTLTVFVMVAAVLSTALMAQAAHLGGQIRHNEIRPGIMVSNAGAEAEADGPAESSENEDDD